MALASPWASYTHPSCHFPLHLALSGWGARSNTGRGIGDRGLGVASRGGGWVGRCRVLGTHGVASRGPGVATGRGRGVGVGGRGAIGRLGTVHRLLLDIGTCKIGIGYR